MMDRVPSGEFLVKVHYEDGRNVVVAKPTLLSANKFFEIAKGGINNTAGPKVDRIEVYQRVVHFDIHSAQPLQDG